MTLAVGRTEGGSRRKHQTPAARADSDAVPAAGDAPRWRRARSRRTAPSRCRGCHSNLEYQPHNIGGDAPRNRPRLPRKPRASRRLIPAKSCAASVSCRNTPGIPGYPGITCAPVSYPFPQRLSRSRTGNGREKKGPFPGPFPLERTGIEPVTSGLQSRERETTADDGRRRPTTESLMGKGVDRPQAAWLLGSPGSPSEDDWPLIGRSAQKAQREVTGNVSAHSRHRFPPGRRRPGPSLDGSKSTSCLMEAPGTRHPR